MSPVMMVSNRQMATIRLIRLRRITCVIAVLDWIGLSTLRFLSITTVGLEFTENRLKMAVVATKKQDDDFWV